MGKNKTSRGACILQLKIRVFQIVLCSFAKVARDILPRSSNFDQILPSALTPIFKIS